MSKHAVFVTSILLALVVGDCRKLPESMRIPEEALRLPSSELPCPCTPSSLCDPVAVEHKKEVFGFSASDWAHMDWDVVTTIAWDVEDPLLVCRAHAAGVRLIAAAPSEMPLSADKSVRAAYINSTLEFVRTHFLDGVTFDYESAMDRASPNRDYYTQIVSETTAALKAINRFSQVSVCVAWSPDAIDGRNYDYVGLAAGSDLLYQMVYDTRSQIYDACIASANAPLAIVQRGIQRYLDIGISPEKLILGVPWYGYVYPCLMNVSSAYCPIKHVPFRGANCSDASGSEYSFRNIMEMVDGADPNITMLTERVWDEDTQSPWFNMMRDGKIYQIWYDDAQSLQLKYDYAKHVGLKGVGPFTFSYLDPLGVTNPKGPSEAKEMWAALRSFLVE